MVRILLFAALLGGIGVLGRAAEIQLRPSAEVAGPTVRLTDIAEITGHDADEVKRLKQIELIPVPYKAQYVTAREIQEALASRRIDLGQHTISGASLVEVRPVASWKKEFREREPSQAGQPQAPRDHQDDLKARVAQTIRRFLQTHVDPSQPWEVIVRLSSDPAPSLADVQDINVVQVPRRPRRGDLRPWLGQQAFLVRWSVTGRTSETRVVAEVRLPPSVVVAARDVPRGTILQSSDVRLKPLDHASPGEQAFERLEDVIGRETLRPLRTGDMLVGEVLRNPLLVRRGDRVTVHVKRGMVQARTEGRAKDPGTLGDEVTVESTIGRKSYRAVVSGPKEVRLEAPANRIAGRETLPR